MQTNTTLFTALTIVSLAEFLSAYPFNVEQVGNEESGESLLVSNLEQSFQLDFAPFRMDGQETDVNQLFFKLGEGDGSIVEDWKLHVQREKFIERQKDNPTEMTDEEWANFLARVPREMRA
jgi:hypothetical protein